MKNSKQITALAIALPALFISASAKAEDCGLLCTALNWVTGYSDSESGNQTANRAPDYYYVPTSVNPSGMIAVNTQTLSPSPLFAGYTPYCTTTTNGTLDFRSYFEQMRGY
jgi:hypothetical protein